MPKSTLYRISLHFAMVIFMICIALPCNLNALDNLAPLDQKVNVHETTRALTNSLHVSSDSSCTDAGNQYCKGSIQSAISDAPTQCTDPCTIKISTGNYNENPTLSSSITVILDGGWNFTSGTKSTGTNINAPTANTGSIILRNLNVKPFPIYGPSSP